MAPVHERPVAPRTVLTVVVALVVAATAAVAPVGGPAAGAQSRRVVVVGDSIILGAQSQITSAFDRNGWATSFDAKVNRSTLAGAQAVAAHAPELSDTLVVSLGANDAGNPATFRQRIDAVMAAAGPVPRVLWLTIREVRDYYGPANQVLRDAAERYPNLDLIDWNGASAGAPGLTAGDGLHLTPAGGGSLAFLVAASVASGPAPAAPAVVPAAPPVAAETTVAATPAAAPVAAGSPAPAAPVDQVPSTLVATTSAPATTVAEPPTTSVRDDVDMAVEDGDSSLVPGIGVTLGGGILLVVGVLAAAGVWIAIWSLLRTRGRSGPAPVPGPARSASDSQAPPQAQAVPPAQGAPQALSRSGLRAARIAAARGHHPTAAPVPPPPVSGLPAVPMSVASETQ